MLAGLDAPHREAAPPVPKSPSLPSGPGIAHHLVRLIRPRWPRLGGDGFSSKLSARGFSASRASASRQRRSSWTPLWDIFPGGASTVEHPQPYSSLPTVAHHGFCRPRGGSECMWLFGQPSRLRRYNGDCCLCVPTAGRTTLRFVVGIRIISPRPPGSDREAGWRARGDCIASGRPSRRPRRSCRTVSAHRAVSTACPTGALACAPGKYPPG